MHTQGLKFLDFPVGHENVDSYLPSVQGSRKSTAG